MFHKLTNPDCKDAVINSTVVNWQKILAGSGLYSVPVASGWGWILKNIRYVIHYGTPVIAETSLYRTQARLFERTVYMATPYRWHTRVCLLVANLMTQ